MNFIEEGINLCVIKLILFINQNSLNEFIYFFLESNKFFLILFLNFSLRLLQATFKARMVFRT